MSIRIPIHIELEALNTRTIERFERSVRTHTSIEECYAVTGSTDYFLFVTVDSFYEFEAIHRDVLTHLPGIRKVRSEIPLRRIVPA